MMTFKKDSQGFTLIEIAIVLLIVSLLIGGIFQGQQLLQNAKAQTLVTEVSSLRASWYSFLDRYKAYPGDFASATLQIDGSSNDGDGNNLIDTKAEVANAWLHLAKSGLISGNFDANLDHLGNLESTTCQSSTCPQNPFTGFYKILWSSAGKNLSQPTHLLFTGDQIPASVLYKLDKEIDDGSPETGSVRVHQDYDNAECINGSDWNGANQESRCAAVIIIL